MKGKRPKEPKTWAEFCELLETVEGLKLDNEGNMAMRYCGKKLQIAKASLIKGSSN